MANFEIVAHRGIPTNAPENTMASFQQAVELGADAFEFDVRLTADRLPVVYHFFYLDQKTNASGTIFDFTYEQLQSVEVRSTNGSELVVGKIPTLNEVLEKFGGRIGLEIEIKGPEPEAAEIIGKILKQYKSIWDSIEVTSYEPALLLEIQKHCPGIKADLLFPRSESWMKLDVVAYQALHRARLAHARAVHLHPSQLSAEVVSLLDKNNIQIHAWDVNDEEALQIIDAYEIPRICTDNYQQAKGYRDKRV
jgi:glycerophosphoryl diester phosphodiesterase